jgi:hypothetical protein
VLGSAGSQGRKVDIFVVIKQGSLLHQGGILILTFQEVHLSMIKNNLRVAGNRAIFQHQRPIR